MAPTGEGHGGLRRNSWRKRKALTDRKEYLKEWNNTHKRIYLKQRIFHAWLQAKFEAGYEACSDSNFALYLLQALSNLQKFIDPESSS